MCSLGFAHDTPSHRSKLLSVTYLLFPLLCLKKCLHHTNIPHWKAAKGIVLLLQPGHITQGLEHLHRLSQWPDMATGWQRHHLTSFPQDLIFPSLIWKPLGKFWLLWCLFFNKQSAVVSLSCFYVSFFPRFWMVLEELYYLKCFVCNVTFQIKKNQGPLRNVSVQ